MRIVVEGDKYTEINFYERVNILTGNSGSGKSYLRRRLSDSIKEGATIKYEGRVSDVNYWLDQVRVNELLLLINNSYNTLFILDEGVDSLCELPEYITLLKSLIKNDNYMIIVERDLIEYPISVNGILEVSRSSRKVIIETSYKFSNNDNKDDNITTEDSKMGLKIFSNIFDSICHSSFGNRNIKHLLDINIKKVKDTSLTYIVDGSVFGSELIHILNNIGLYDNVVFYFPPSLEYIILKHLRLINNSNKWLLNYEDVVLRTDENFEIKEIGLRKYDIKSIERYFTFLLRYLLKKEMGLVYDKSSFDISKLNLDYDKLYKEMLMWRGKYKDNIYDGFLTDVSEDEHSMASYDSFSKSMLGGCL